MKWQLWMFWWCSKQLDLAPLIVTREDSQAYNNDFQKSSWIQEYHSSRHSKITLAFANSVLEKSRLVIFTFEHV